MIRLWAVYATVDHRPGQVLVLTQFADAGRRAPHDRAKDEEWPDDENESEAPGAIPIPE